MIKIPKPSLSSAPFIASLLVIVIMGSFIGLFWAVSEYEAYQESVANIRANYQQQYKKRVSEELDRIFDFIEYKRSQQDSRIEAEIREKVQSAYSIAAHVYSLYGDEASIEELRQMVVEMLRPIRWDHGLGYYFAGRTSSGIMDLFADKPQYEGYSMLKAKDPNLRKVIAAMIDIIKAKGAGQLRYKWSKPEAAEGVFPKVTFVKYFKPFDWFLGTGIYVDEMEMRIQKDILDRIQRIEFGNRGEVIVFRLDGTIIGNQDRTMLGRSVTTIKDAAGNVYGRKILQLAQSVKGNGFFEFKQGMKDVGKFSERLGYVKVYKNWNWAIATSMSMLDMEEAISVETSKYEEIAFKNTTLFIILFILAVSILLLATYLYSTKIRSGIDHFTEFFRRAADAKVRVEKDELDFKEFEVLGEYANRMNEDRRKKEEVIKRDERRLDTLLQLGMMENQSLKDHFDFILKRIVEITASQAGYLLTFEDSKTKLQSSIVKEEGKYQIAEPAESLFGDYDATLQRVIHKKSSIVRRRVDIPSWQTLFPLKENITERLDVPYFDEGKLVVILGLCNKRGGYGEDDKRQVKLLLEGMWLHLTRVANRQEMLRLRQLLKNITDSMPSVLIGVDDQLRVMQWNRLAEIQTGILAYDAEERSLTEVFPRMQQYVEKIQEVVVSGKQTEIRRVPYTINDEKRYESITVYPLDLENTQGAVLRLDDVTEIVGMEEIMIQSEKMLSVGGLAAGIAHELNNPLASVTQNLQVVKRRLSNQLARNHDVAYELGLELHLIHEYLERRGINHMLNLISTDSSRAAKLVHNMLAFSRKSTSIFALNDVCELLDNALEFGLADYDQKKQYDLKHICLNKDYDDNLKKVNCEGVNIQQVFLNIITNAVYAINENADNIEEPTMSMTVKDEGEMVRIEITDNGIGMDWSTQKKVFDPFYTTKGVGKGTGLGLSISYYIITEQHNGSLKVISTPGKGSTFIIHLPYAHQQL